MFPTTDSSETIINCLLGEARRSGVQLRANCGVERVTKGAEGFRVVLNDGEVIDGDQLLLAIGGCRTPALGQLAVSLGHTLEPPVPSLFTFHIGTPWLRALAGVSVESALNPFFNRNEISKLRCM